jgi:hypothetical protein
MSKCTRNRVPPAGRTGIVGTGRSHTGVPGLCCIEQRSLAREDTPRNWSSCDSHPAETTETALACFQMPQSIRVSFKMRHSLPLADENEGNRTRHSDKPPPKQIDGVAALGSTWYTHAFGTLWPYGARKHGDPSVLESGFSFHTSFRTFIAQGSFAPPSAPYPSLTSIDIH